MKTLIPHPPSPLLLQEKGVKENLGDNPQTPTREARPFWTLHCFQWGLHPLSCVQERGQGVRSHDH